MKDYNKYSDETLCALLSEGHPICDEAFDVLYHRHRHKLYSYCLNLANNKAQANDLFQETWIIFNSKAKGNARIYNALAYLISIARYELYKQKKKSERQQTIISVDTDASLEDILDESSLQNNIEKGDLLSLIEIAVQNLDEPHREAFVMKMFADMDTDDIAKNMNESRDAVRQRIRRASQKIKEFLKPYIKDISENK